MSRQNVQDDALELKVTLPKNTLPISKLYGYIEVTEFCGLESRSRLAAKYTPDMTAIKNKLNI